MNDNETEKIIQEYSENYCLFLEAAYGAHMISEGGEQAIDRMFNQENLRDQKILDIGFGLGGVAFYLAEKHHAQVSGVEINPWLVDEARRRTPGHLKSQVKLYHYHPNNALPFPDESFDVVFSKGVLTHVKNKAPLFNEVNRVLKPRGVFVVDDWLSPHKDQWGERLKKMCQTEGLTLYAETVENYRQLLSQAHFKDIDVRDENKHYHQYNLAIVERLKKEKKEGVSPVMDDAALDEAIEGHQLIADSIGDNELLIRWIRAIKS
jgi:ubiquinone/menaquinone biosynthesis C-methylase UbiE